MVIRLAWGDRDQRAAVRHLDRRTAGALGQVAHLGSRDPVQQADLGLGGRRRQAVGVPQPDGHARRPPRLAGLPASQRVAVRFERGQQGGRARTARRADLGQAGRGGQRAVVQAGFAGEHVVVVLLARP